MIGADRSGMTWYEATVDRGSARPALAGRVEAGACVIGGGLAGLTAALELARRGTSVVLLEARRIAWGASGRNGGFVSNGFAEGMGNVARRVGLPAAQALYRLSCEGTEFVRREIAGTDPSVKMGDGWQGCIRYSSAAAKQAAVAEMTRDYGQPMEFLDVAETRARVNTRRYFQSSYDPTAFHMHPLRYALMIAGSAAAAGARIYENSPALSVEKQGAAWSVRTAQGEVRAANVVYCVSSLDRTLHRPTGRAVLPVATYVAVTEPLRQDVIRTRSAISDTRRAGNYYRLIDGGRLLWGGAITTRVSEPARLAERMKGDMVSVFPELGNPRIDYAWAGLMGYARHFMPLISCDGQGQWWATAFGGHGMNTTAMGGILMARAISAGDDEYRRFGAYAPEWAGGPFGRMGVQAGYWYMQLKDLIDERRHGKAA
ncbi:FAD-binding oxidoreductase [Aestuariivirga sp.]|uniref:NAD(P)/FAD-dependent oxidoreductase n=1 Tax=Aestuariivirga sp. TaxID=2650926 RepID=UPI0025BF564C|nr:FAD-binding oxidoreductase [Aestuariivirga sp.]MCA3554634.1 FAD-binding oxidoreductase [Aestuariivirga sp.]